MLSRADAPTSVRLRAPASFRFPSPASAVQRKAIWRRQALAAFTSERCGSCQPRPTSLLWWMSHPTRVARSAQRMRLGLVDRQTSRCPSSFLRWNRRSLCPRNHNQTTASCPPVPSRAGNAPGPVADVPPPASGVDAQRPPRIRARKPGASATGAVPPPSAVLLVAPVWDRWPPIARRPLLLADQRLAQRSAPTPAALPPLPRVPQEEHHDRGCGRCGQGR
jgi:hypothetical protein